jgi:hypothetical protein
MPKIEPLSDGTSPTFRQWQASIRDRLEFSQDQYPSERARMAEVWGHTEGLAKEYLEPQYLSQSVQNQFRTASEMIELLKTYFVSGNEEAEYRTAFHKLQMDRSETFPAFKARFLSAAIKGQVNKEEWFFYLWEKITPTLRMPNLGFKATWNNSFEKMVTHLTAFDMERRNAPTTTPMRSTQPQLPRVKPSWDQRQTTSGVTVQPRIEVPRQPTYPRHVSATPAPRPQPQALRQQSQAPDTTKLEGNCYNCGKAGHFAKDCNAPRVQLVDAKQEEEEETDQFVDAVDYTDPYQSGNEDA